MCDAGLCLDAPFVVDIVRVRVADVECSLAVRRGRRKICRGALFARIVHFEAPRSTLGGGEARFPGQGANDLTLESTTSAGSSVIALHLPGPPPGTGGGSGRRGLRNSAVNADGDATDVRGAMVAYHSSRPSICRATRPACESWEPTMGLVASLTMRMQTIASDVGGCISCAFAFERGLLRTKPCTGIARPSPRVGYEMTQRQRDDERCAGCSDVRPLELEPTRTQQRGDG